MKAMACGVKGGDEDGCGDYRTKYVILEVYDAMAESMKAEAQLELAKRPKP